MKSKQRGFTAFELIIGIVWLFAIGGWVSNIVQIAESNFDPITGLLVLRIIGIFVAPLGAV